MSKADRKLSATVRACAVLTLVAILGLASFAATAAALPSRFWGVVPQAIPTQEQFQRLHRGGVESIRVPIIWGAAQPKRNGVIDWSGTDGIVERAAASGVEVLPFITGAPTWAVPSVHVPGAGSAKAPAHLPATGSAASAWKSFVTQAVVRYGPEGSFWAEHPTLPSRPIRAWQIWNEENFKYFVAKPNPAEYGSLVKISSAAIKAVDPGAQVVLGGMFSRPKGSRTKSGKHKSLNWFASDFVEQMYKRNPGIKARFNGVALHPYTGKYQELTPEIEEFRAILSENHDSGKGLWITELGWSSQPPAPATNIFAKGVAGQANQLKGAFSLLERRQAKWRLQRVYWFSVDDAAGACNFCDGSGLFKTGFVPKKSWYAYVKFAGGTP
ncbi:MAG: glycosyl hydrolase [Solirubrobacterales bacterium]